MNCLIILDLQFSERVSGVEDWSGITLHVTPHLRKYDAGILELGLEYNNKMAVPPGLVWIVTKPFHQYWTFLVSYDTKESVWLVESSVADPWHFSTDPDPRIRTSD
jgi:hypothetical protein